MTSKKILEYLQAELEWNMRQKPNREYCSDDEEYNTECIAWDAECFLLNKLIDDIKEYDTNKDAEEYVNSLIKRCKKKDISIVNYGKNPTNIVNNSVMNIDINIKDNGQYIEHIDTLILKDED